jgi:hypothetical protein
MQIIELKIASFPAGKTGDEKKQAKQAVCKNVKLNKES